MKKVISVLLCFAALMSFGACDLFGGKEDNAVPTTSKRVAIIEKNKVAEAVKEGKVTGAKFALGADINEVKEYFFNIVSPWTITASTKIVKKGGTTRVVTGESPYDNTQIVTAIGEHEDLYKYYVGNALTSVSYDGEDYFYVNGKENEGAAIIVCNKGAFGFEAGNCLPADIETSLGKPHAEDVPPAEQLFFCLGTPINPTRYTYNYGDNRLDFIFQDGNLLMVVLTDTTVYTGFVTVNNSAQSTAATAEASATASAQ